MSAMSLFDLSSDVAVVTGADIRGAGGRAIAVTTDVTNEEAAEKLAEAAVGEFGSLDIWVNNAGMRPASRQTCPSARDSARPE